MSLRPSLTLLLSLLLISCGFHPMYGDAAMEATHTPLQGNLLVVTQSGGRMGQLLKIALEDRFNPEGIKFARPDYKLEASILKSLIPAVVRSDGTILRYDIRLDSNFRLIRLADGKVLMDTGVRRTGSYNVAVNANFATYEGEQDVTARTITEIAEDYVLRISGYFASQPTDKPLEPALTPPAPPVNPIFR